MKGERGKLCISRFLLHETLSDQCHNGFVHPQHTNSLLFLNSKGGWLCTL